MFRKAAYQCSLLPPLSLPLSLKAVKKCPQVRIKKKEGKIFFSNSNYSQKIRKDNSFLADGYRVLCLYVFSKQMMRLECFAYTWKKRVYNTIEDARCLM